MEQIRAVLLGILCAVSSGAYASLLPPVVNDWLAVYTQNLPDDLTQDYYQILWDIYQHPYNLNTVTRQELEMLPFLSDMQIENLLEYKHDRDFFATPYELALVQGFDKITLSLIYPFVTADAVPIQKPFSFKTCFTQANHQVTSRFDYTFKQEKDSSNNAYLGKPWAGYINYQLNQTHFSLNCTMEKDAGEPFTLPYNAGFDFYSGNLSFKDIGILKTAVVGDYLAQFGQGLVIGSNNSYSSFCSISSLAKRQDKVYGKKKGAETYFLRGVGVSLQSKHWQFSVLGSYKSIDQAQGVHRTLQELAKKNTGATWLVGGNVMARYTHFKVGCTFMYDAFSKLAFMGVDYRTYFKNFQFSGEIACNHAGKIATIHQITAYLHSSLQWGIQGWYYAPQYNHSFGYAIPTENSYKNGEGGVLMGIEWQIINGLQVNAMVNLTQKLNPQYRISKNSIAYKTYMGITYQFKEKQQLAAFWKWNKQERNASTTIDGIVPTYPYTKNQVQIQYQGELNNGFYLKTGWVASFFQYHQDPLTIGNLLFQDIGYKSPLWQLIGRLAFYDIAHYDNKITVYENDVLYAFSNTGYYGKGIRFYLNAGIKPYKGWGIYLKIDGPYPTSLHAVVQYKW